MKSWNDLYKILISILGLSAGMLIILILLYGNFYFGVATPKVFYHIIDQEKLDEKLLISREELKKVADCMVEYVKRWHPSEHLLVNVTIKGEKTCFFTESEKEHLEDVRTILTTMSQSVICCILIWIFLTGFLLITRRTKEFCIGYFMAIACFLIVSIGIGVWAALDIKGFIMLFHQILMPNNLWIMNPMKEKIVYFFPDSLYKMALVRFIIFSFAEFLLLTMLFFGGYKRKKISNTQKHLIVVKEKEIGHKRH